MLSLLMSPFKSSSKSEKDSVRTGKRVVSSSRDGYSDRRREQRRDSHSKTHRETRSDSNVTDRRSLGWEDKTRRRSTQRDEGLHWSLENVALDAALEFFFEVFEPSRIALIPAIIEEFREDEEVLLRELCNKYNLREKDMQHYLDKATLQTRPKSYAYAAPSSSSSASANSLSRIKRRATHTMQGEDSELDEDLELSQLEKKYGSAKSLRYNQGAGLVKLEHKKVSAEVDDEEEEEEEVYEDEVEHEHSRSRVNSNESEPPFPPPRSAKHASSASSHSRSKPLLAPSPKSDHHHHHHHRHSNHPHTDPQPQPRSRHDSPDHKHHDNKHHHGHGRGRSTERSRDAGREKSRERSRGRDKERDGKGKGKGERDGSRSHSRDARRSHRDEDRDERHHSHQHSRSHSPSRDGHSHHSHHSQSSHKRSHHSHGHDDDKHGSPHGHQKHQHEHHHNHHKHHPSRSKSPSHDSHTSHHTSHRTSHHSPHHHGHSSHHQKHSHGGHHSHHSHHHHRHPDPSDAFSQSSDDEHALELALLRMEREVEAELSREQQQQLTRERESEKDALARDKAAAMKILADNSHVLRVAANVASGAVMKRRPPPPPPRRPTWDTSTPVPASQASELQEEDSNGAKGDNNEKEGKEEEKPGNGEDSGLKAAAPVAEDPNVAVVAEMQAMQQELEKTKAALEAASKDRAEALRLLEQATNTNHAKMVSDISALLLKTPPSDVDVVLERYLETYHKGKEEEARQKEREKAEKEAEEAENASTVTEVGSEASYAQPVSIAEKERTDLQQLSMHAHTYPANYDVPSNGKPPLPKKPQSTASFYTSAKAAAAAAAAKVPQRIVSSEELPDYMRSTAANLARITAMPPPAPYDPLETRALPPQSSPIRTASPSRNTSRGSRHPSPSPSMSSSLSYNRNLNFNTSLASSGYASHGPDDFRVMLTRPSSSPDTKRAMSMGLRVNGFGSHNIPRSPSRERSLSANPSFSSSHYYEQPETLLEEQIQLTRRLHELKMEQSKMTAALAERNLALASERTRVAVIQQQQRPQHQNDWVELYDQKTKRRYLYSRARGQAVYL